MKYHARIEKFKFVNGLIVAYGQRVGVAVRVHSAFSDCAAILSKCYGVFNLGVFKKQGYLFGGPVLRMIRFLGLYGGPPI